MNKDKEIINNLSNIAKDIATQYKIKGCVILLSDGNGGVRIGIDGLDNGEVLYCGNILNYYTVKREFEQTND